MTGATDGIGKAYAEAVSIVLDLSVYKTNPLGVLTELNVFRSLIRQYINPYPTAFPYGTVWFYTSTSDKRAARPKLYTKSLTRDLKLMYSRFTLVRISINL